MSDMPRQRPPHLQRERTRHGKAVWYVRVGKGPRIRINADYGTPGFDLSMRRLSPAARSGRAAPHLARSHGSMNAIAKPRPG
jgi:hypothetical protein